MNLRPRPLRTPVALATAAALTVLPVLSACSGDTDPSAKDDRADDTVAECQEADPGGSFEWTDGRGETIALDEVPSTVVAQTSVAAALWDAGYQVDGVFGETDTSTPGTAEQLGNVDLDQVEVIGSTWGEFDVDKYAEMQPDLLLDYVFDGALWYVPSKQQKQLEKLAPIGGVNGQPDDIDSAIASFVDLAGLLGADTDCNDALTAAEAEYDAGLAALEENGADVQVLIASATPEQLYVVNPAQLPEARTLQAAGVDVLGPEEDDGQVFAEYSWEEIGRFAEADVILLDGRNTDDTRDALESIDTWTSLPAVQAGQVHTWHAGAPYSYQEYADILTELADVLGTAEDVGKS